jgi:hypothetical protein
LKALTFTRTVKTAALKDSSGHSSYKRVEQKCEGGRSLNILSFVAFKQLLAKYTNESLRVMRTTFPLRCHHLSNINSLGEINKFVDEVAARAAPELDC